MSPSLLDVGYRHWNRTVRPVWARRATVAGHTLRSCLHGRFIRFLLGISWVLSLATVAAYFAIGQILVPDGLLQPLINLLPGRGRQVVDGVSAWLALYPDITVRAVADFLLLQLSGLLQTVSFLIITVTLPRLITRDLASNAIIVYSSRAISRFDYLFGKLLGLLGVLSLSWLGPVIAVWILGNVVAPDWAFFWHSRSGLGHALIAIIPAMGATALVVLAISALSSNGRVTVGAWLGLWLLTGALVPLARITRPWLAYLSFSHDIEQWSLAVFRPYRDFARARDSLPFFDNVFGGVNSSAIQSWGEVPMLGPGIGLLLAATLAVIILLRRIQTR